MNIIVSDKNQDYHAFFAEALNACEGREVKGIALVILTDDENLTGYWNMNIYDKTRAETEIRFDAFDDFFNVNKERYGVEEDEE